MKTPRHLTPLVACLLLALTHAAAAPTSASVTVAASDDTSVKIHCTEPILYPLSLESEGVSHGEVRFLLDIDAAGNLVDTLVLGYTHEPFVRATLAAVPKWRFEAARHHGEAVGVVTEITLRFEVDGIILVQRGGPPQFRWSNILEPPYVYRPLGLRTLDRIPTPLQVTRPIYPKEWLDQGIHGDVTVDFYIDETGTVRMPTVDNDAHPLLAAAATAAVRSWRFAPPLRNGRPALAHCQQVFHFDPATAKP